MNKDNAREYLPLVQALAEGKTIQCRQVPGGWTDMDRLNFNAPPNEYRIKPEPREIWVRFNEKTTLVLEQKSGAEMNLTDCIKFREVMGEDNE